jgi:transposase
MLLSEGQMSDYKGAALMIDAFPKTKALLADRGYDADWFRQALAELGITACILSKTNRKVPIPHDGVLFAWKGASRTIRSLSRQASRTAWSSSTTMLTFNTVIKNHRHGGNSARLSGT